VVDSKNIRTRITRSKMVNPTKNTRRKKKIWMWTLNDVDFNFAICVLNFNYFEKFVCYPKFVVIVNVFCCKFSVVLPMLLSTTQFCSWWGWATGLSMGLTEGDLPRSWLKP
jgi:hypothetical protein